MDNRSFDSKRIALGYAKRPWLHKSVIEQLLKDCNLGESYKFKSGLDVGCGAGLSTKALRLICDKVTGTDIADSMVEVCKKLYGEDNVYSFYVARAEETNTPDNKYDIVTAAGVINWVDEKKFMANMFDVMEDGGLLVIYDFGITDKMAGSEAYTTWYRDEYLKRFPKPFRKENKWTQADLPDGFTMEKQTEYDMEYEFDLESFADFMLIQSNVNAQIEGGSITAEEAREWMKASLLPIFEQSKKNLIFHAYSWYIRKNKIGECWGMERFDEIRYERPDFELLKEKTKAVEDAVKAGVSFEEIDKLNDELQSYGNHCLSMATYMYIQSFIDGTNEEVAAETANVMGQLAAANSVSLNEAILTSPYRAHFEETNGKFLLESMEKKQALFREGEEYAIKEQEIIAQIHKLASEMEFDYNGEKVSASKIGTLKNSADREVRKAARHAERAGFAENGEAFGSLLDELIKTRHKLATANGFKNYLEYADIEKDRFSYGEAQLREFVENVKKIILPIVEKSNKAFQKRLGLAHYTTDDTNIYFTDGNAMPISPDLDFAVDNIQKMYDDMSPRLGDAFRRMRENGYLKLEYSDKKVTGIAFSVPMPEQKIPFIYANYLGSGSDLNDIIHETGHTMQIQLSMDKYENQELHSQVQDLKEVPSKTMELISLEYADMFFGKDAEKHRKSVLADFLDDITGFCRWFDFETFIYENPGATAQERIDKYNELFALYLPGVEMMDQDLLSKGAALYRGFNIFGMPRYTITYSLCNLSAIYLANEFKKDKKKGTELFIKLGEIGKSMDYNEAIAYMGLKSSFSEDVIREIGEYLETELEL